jgi:hypothetical protein
MRNSLGDLIVQQKQPRRNALGDIIVEEEQPPQTQPTRSQSFTGQRYDIPQGQPSALADVSGALNTLTDVSLDTAPALIGGAIGALPVFSGPTLGASVPIGQAAGGAIGNTAKQLWQKARGERDEFSFSELALQTGAGAAVPIKAASGVVAPMAKQALRASAVGAGVGATSVTGESLINKQELPSVSDLAVGTIAGATYGMGIGTASAAATKQTRPASLKELDEIFTPPAGPSIPDEIAKVPHKLQQYLVSAMSPLKRLEDKVFKLTGSSRIGIDLSRKFEQIAGAPARAEADIIRFDNLISSKVYGDELNFNEFLFLNRAKNRVGRELETGDWDIPKIEQGLKDLEAHVGTDKMLHFQKVADDFQKSADEVLRLQVSSGRLSPMVYDAIKKENDFYAPFRVMTKLNEFENSAGRAIDTGTELVKAIRGVAQKDLKLGDMLMAQRENILKGTILADKNLKMQELAGLTEWDTAGVFVKKVAADAEAPRGKALVHYFDEGTRHGLAVDPDVAKAIQGLNETQTGLVMKTLAMSSPAFRAGATTANAAFQVVNALGADLPRLALMSKYGALEGKTFKNAIFETVRLPIDWGHALFSSIKGNFGRPNDLYMQWLDSGAARSTIQDALRDMGSKGVVASNASVRKHGVLDAVGDFANAIEETAKIAGLKRGLRMEGFEKASPEAQKRIMENVAAEVRNYAGSPDFMRRGLATQDANLIFMFFNARIQGVASDFSRLALGRDGWKRSAITTAKMASAIGVPTVALWNINNFDENRKDFELIPEAERSNYWMIPRYNEDGSPKRFTNDEGQSVRDYWRVPKREIVKIFANTTESALNFARDKDPQAVLDFGIKVLENVSPLSIEGDNFSERIQSVVSSTNPLIKAPVQMGLGKNTFFKRDTIPARLKGGIGGVSPEKQFTESTPKLFIRAAQQFPDFLPEQLRSPLYLEQLTQDVSAGLVTQFLKGKPQEGREEWTTYPVLKRFVRTQFVANDKDVKLVKELDRASTDARIDQTRYAEDFLDSLPLLPPDKRTAAVQELLSKDDQTFDRLVNVFEGRMKGWNADDKRVGLLQVQDGSRAEFIARKMQEMDPQERIQYYQNLIQKDLISEEVALQLVPKLKGIGSRKP